MAFSWSIGLAFGQSGGRLVRGEEFEDLRGGKGTAKAISRGARYGGLLTALLPIIFGGGQQKDLRSGTENVPGIAGLGAAAEEACRDLEETMGQVRALRDRLAEGLAALPEVVLNSPSGEIWGQLTLKRQYRMEEGRLKYYVDTTLNIDDHNRIPTTDARLLRRMTRDARTRGYSASATISMWPSVRRGEESHIFPYQDSADVIFNSALIYETSLLRPYVEPMLYAIDKSDPAYTEARRLLKFLDYFLPIPADVVPLSSIAREFIGGGCYNV